MQSHLEYAALSLGASSSGTGGMSTVLNFAEQRLILHTGNQLASNFICYFTKLLQLIERLSREFSQYSQIANLYKDVPSNRLKDPLVQVYVDLFPFFQSTARIFTKADAGKDVSDSPFFSGQWPCRD